MKTTKILGATTLASALLFTGVNAYAAENVTKSQAEESVKNFVTNNNNYHPNSRTQFLEESTYSTNPIDNSYSIAFGEVPNQSPSFLYVKKDSGDIYNADGQLVKKGNTNSQSQTTNSTVNNNSNNQGMAQNNEQPAQATDNTVNNNANDQAMTQDGQQQTQAMNNTAVANHNANEQQTNQMTQSDAKVLPETGETASNGTLVTLVASVLLAAGSLLTFKRFSKNNQ
ncbi:hypothetical protein BUY46_05180 [Staphylococcus devriesei]|nr:hypothetical protein BUY46_05180 [Staphylococcus devriesei]